MHGLLCHGSHEMSKLPHYHQLMHPLASPDRGPSSYRERPSFVYKIQSLPSFTINPSLFSPWLPERFNCFKNEFE